jgi:hypothetical protein
MAHSLAKVRKVVLQAAAQERQVLRRWTRRTRAPWLGSWISADHGTRMAIAGHNYRWAKREEAAVEEAVAAGPQAGHMSGVI